jgi:hypothetical protein
MYKLYITKSVENENYEEQKKEYLERNRYNTRYNDDVPFSKTIQVKSLEVELTDEEFKKLKSGVLSIFE